MLSKLFQLLIKEELSAEIKNLGNYLIIRLCYKDVYNPSYAEKFIEFRVDRELANSEPIDFLVIVKQCIEQLRSN